jgi:H+/Cl- antiporter ClcA
VPLLLAVALATIVARLLGSPSIYSARLAVEDALAAPAALAGQGVPT